MINVPRLFSPVWSIISMLLPEVHFNCCSVTVTVHHYHCYCYGCCPRCTPAHSRRHWGGAWGREILYRFLGQAHKERIVLLSTSKSTREELSKYMPERHMPPHIRNDTGADTSSE